MGQKEKGKLCWPLLPNGKCKKVKILQLVICYFRLSNDVLSVLDTLTPLTMDITLDMYLPSQNYLRMLTEYVYAILQW